MMRRLPHGGTSRPPLARPGSGYGRPVRTGPPASWREHDVVVAARRRDPMELLVGSRVTVDQTIDVDVSARS